MSFILLLLESRLKRVLVYLKLSSSLGIQAVLFCLDIDLMHVAQVLVELFLLLLLNFGIFFINLNLRVEQLFTFYSIHLLSVLQLPFLKADSVQSGGLLLHPLERFFIFSVGFVLGHLIN